MNAGIPSFSAIPKRPIVRSLPSAKAALPQFGSTTSEPERAPKTSAEPVVKTDIDKTLTFKELGPIARLAAFFHPSALKKGWEAAKAGLKKEKEQGSGKVNILSWALLAGEVVLHASTIGLMLPLDMIFPNLNLSSISRHFVKGVHAGAYERQQAKQDTEDTPGS